MLLEFFRFDLRYQLRQPLLWVTGAVMALLAFFAIHTDAVQIGGAVGNVHRNAPIVIAQFFSIFSVWSLFIVTLFIAGSVLRDFDFGMADLLFSTPMRKIDYLVGRFSAGLLASLIIFVVIALGMLAGSIWPTDDPARLGAISLTPYLWSMAVIVLPNLLFYGAMMILLASTTRSLLYAYVGVLAFFGLWIISIVFTKNINNEWLAVLADPFGARAFSRMTRYYSIAESNSILPPFSGYLLANRLVWTSVGLGMFGLAIWLFKPLRAGTGRALIQPKTIANAAGSPAINVQFLRVKPSSGAGVVLKQCLHVFRFEVVSVMRSLPFVIMLLLALVIFVVSAFFSNEIYGTKVYPVTHLMLQNLAGNFSFMLVLVVIFYAGELIFRERQLKISDVVDAMPVPSWVFLLAKSGAMLSVVVIFLLAGSLASLIFQVFKGGVPVQPFLYVKGVILDSIYFLLIGLLAISLQVICNQKYIGFFLTCLAMVAPLVLPYLRLEHNLYSIEHMPGAPYSDMNGYGHFLQGRLWFAAYWLFFNIAVLIVAYTFWIRGLAPGWKSRVIGAAHLLRGRSGVALGIFSLAWVGCGAWIYYNTNVLNHYVPGDVAMDRQANYEKQFRKYKSLPQPRITDVRAIVDIYPESRSIDIRGHYRLENKTAAPIDTLYVQLDPSFPAKLEHMPEYQLVKDDKDSGFQILKLTHALPPGEAMDMDFSVEVRNKGFTNSAGLDDFGGSALKVNHNGTFFNNQDYFPHLGYQPSAELQDRSERRKRGLGEPERMAKLEDEKARMNPDISNDADWINFDTTVSTSANQKAVAPGYLQETWEKDGRRYFHYKMDRPMLSFFSYLSADWQIKKGEWHGIPIEIYFDAKHAYNVDRMIEATQKSLDYYTANFGPYQHRQVRILEFPRYASFAQSFANTIPFSEEIGFIADLRNKDDIDYVYFVTAHEMAHQWWGHQLVGGDVQGSAMLAESMAQYSAMMVMEKTYGREHMRRFLKFELDNYLRNRGGERIEEQPLYRVENQRYIHYQKGALVFYRLRDEIGEAPLNRALKRYLQDKAYQNAPYTTSKEMLDYIRAETPADKQQLVTDLFEKIVFYDNRVVDAKAVQRKDGKWDVTMKLHLRKYETDGQGKESSRTYDEPVEIGVFAKAADGKEDHEKILMLDKRKLLGAEPSVTVTVAERPYEVGVDPFNILIDRVPSDNRKTVTIDQPVM